MTKAETKRLLEFAKKSIDYSYYFNYRINHRLLDMIRFEKKNKSFILKIVEKDTYKVTLLKSKEKILEFLEREGPFLYDVVGYSEFYDAVYPANNWRKRIHRFGDPKSYYVHF